MPVCRLPARRVIFSTAFYSSFSGTKICSAVIKLVVIRQEYCQMQGGEPTVHVKFPELALSGAVVRIATLLFTCFTEGSGFVFFLDFWESVGLSRMTRPHPFVGERVCYMRVCS